MTEKPYNPLDYDNLTKNLILEMMSRGPFTLPPGKRFTGPGVYALFYTGSLPAYTKVRSPDATKPIYVGKAVPPGARKGGEATWESTPSLYRRLNEHAKSIDSAKNLQIGDFLCRYMVVIPLWITMSERFLIEHYKPVWNVCIEGFGIHDPGGGRYAGEISWWDALHPGRSLAKPLKKTRTVTDAEKRLMSFFASTLSEKPKKNIP